MTFEVTTEELGFGDHRESRAIVSSPWTIGTRELESYVEEHNPFNDPWYDQAHARLMIHEEEIMISLPGGSTQEVIDEAIGRIKMIRLHLDK